MLPVPPRAKGKGGTVSYFDIKRDIEIGKAGGFFCQACVIGKPASEQSPDPRYCLSCFDVLTNEASLLPSNKRPKWVPKAKNTPEKSIQVVDDVVLNMSPINGEKNKVDIIQSRVAKVTRSKRGPKFTELPDDLIRQWASEGMGSKAISTRLKAEGYDVSYKTIQRRLQGVLV